MKEPNDADIFIIDFNHGTHYHMPDCWARSYGNYEEKTYLEIKRLANYHGGKFKPHGCVAEARYQKFLSQQEGGGLDGQQ